MLRAISIKSFIVCSLEDNHIPIIHLKQKCYLILGEIIIHNSMLHIFVTIMLIVE